MDSVTKQYPGSFFKLRHRLKWRAPIVADALEKTFDLHSLRRSIHRRLLASIVDVGCATGELVLELAKRNYNVCGLEGSEWAFKFMEEEAAPRIFRCDLREKLSPIRYGYDLVLSFEVAEHIEEKYVEIYLDNLCMLGDRILITAAGPGQKGHNHFNCQSEEYWEEKFNKRNYNRNTLREDIFSKCLEPWRRKRELTSYRINNLIFERV